jgi:DNA-binding response OmpR family regulator
MKVLIVDDSLETRKLMAAAIERMGHSVILASDGTHGWNTLLDNPDIKLLITDMMMPRLDGRQFLNLVRSRPEFVDLPVIIVSGFISMNEVIDLLESGASRFMPKPVNISELKQYVTTLLEYPSQQYGAQ